MPEHKLTTTRLADMKRKGERIVAVTAYDAPTARPLNDAGDSGGGPREDLPRAGSHLRLPAPKPRLRLTQ
ncbi:MAG: hypothetical protein ABII00_01005 [Elusimicrobiota bacterium]